MIALAALLLLPAAAAPAAEPVEITVVARRGACRLRLADREIPEAALLRRADAWAGVPVRVVHPRGADRRCLARLVFRLAERGVTLIEYVDAGDGDDRPALDRPDSPR